MKQNNKDRVFIFGIPGSLIVFGVILISYGLTIGWLSIGIACLIQSLYLHVVQNRKMNQK